MFYITFVLYNKHIEEISSGENIRFLVEKYGTDNIKVIVIDNSDNAKFVSDNRKSWESFCDGIKYIKNDENLGLARSYNRVLKFVFKSGADSANDFMMFMDDDTLFSYEYLESVYLAALENRADNEAFDKDINNIDISNKINVIAGLINSGGIPMSPLYSFKFSYGLKDYVTEAGIYDDIICINSGTAVRLEALRKVGGFEKRLFMDMVDYTLFYKLRRRALCKVLILPVKTEQRFSGRTRMDKKSALRRYEIFKKDFEVYSEIAHLGKLFTKIYLLKRRVMLELKSGD